VLDLGDRTLVAVAVMSGSGARYVGQHYEWWTKGDGATFTDLMQDPQAPVQCTPSK
jgi:membrane-bound inhibitor of C-type lysozyme